MTAALDLLKQAQANITAAMAILDPFVSGTYYPPAVTVDLRSVKIWKTA